MPTRTRTVDRSRAEENAFRPLSLLKDYVAPGLALAGAVIYAVIRLAYFFFYHRLRTSPEEVGYGYSRILSESVVGAIAFLFVLFIPIFLISLGASALGALVRGRAGKKESFIWARGSTARALWRRKALRSLTAALIVIVIAYPLLGWRQGVLAQRGITVRNVYFAGIPYLPILPVQAVPARVVPLEDRSDDALHLLSRTCLLYLGASDGTVVFYDVATRESVRVPASSVSISLTYTFYVSPECSGTM